MIPRRLIRSVPEHTTGEVDDFWAIAVDLHPTWQHITFRDPIDPARFPASAPIWPYAASGAQLAGLVRLEALWTLGGVWIDSDVELFQPLDPLLDCLAFAAWEDSAVVPDAVIGAVAGHPAIGACLDLAIARIRSTSTDWRTGNGAWSTGPGVTTTILPNRPDVVILPRESFYPYGYWEKDRRHDDHRANPNTYGAHHWAGSWLADNTNGG